MSPTLAFILGIDGGGTKTVACLAPLDELTNSKILGRGSAGPGNPRAAGFETALSNIAAAISAAFADAKLQPTPAVAACFGLAGAGREIEQQRIAAWVLQNNIAQKIRVTGDAEPILAAASPENIGIALICGTGSFAWGRNHAGQIARAGGWGYLIGDEGGAYSIARAALISAVRAADGRGPSTILLDDLQQQLDAPAPSDLIDRIYAPEMTRERLATLAKIVFDAAPADPVATQIINGAATDLAELITALAKRLAFTANSYPLAIAGSVILQQPLIRDLLQEQLRAANRPPASTALVPDPVLGALSLARALIQQSPIPQSLVK